MDQDEQNQLEPVSRVEAMERAEIDLQIATARRFPRPVNTKVISEQIILHSTISESTAQDCYYAIPRAGIVIQGPSVRLSEIVAAAYGNLHVAGRIIDHNFIERSVTAQAVAWDLQNNVRRTAEWAEPITQKANDAIKMTKMVAISKAERNAIFKTVPRAIWQPALERCIDKAIGDSASLATRVAAAFKAFSAYGIVPEQILAAFSHERITEFSQTDLANLLGMHTALKEGTAAIDDIFKPISRQGGTVTSDRIDRSGHDADQNVTPGVAFAQPVPPNPPMPPPRRRGRPPRKESQNEPSPQVPAQPEHSVDAPQSVPQPVEQDAPFPEPERNDSGIQVGTVREVNPKDSAIFEIRSNLERAQKSEARLLAKLHEWRYTDNPAAGLEDVGMNELTMITKRWKEILQYL